MTSGQTAPSGDAGGAPTLVAGIDSSTQSTKIVVVDAADGRVVATSRASHPDGSEVHPDRWWDALVEACSALPDGVGAGIVDAATPRVAAVAVGGQQHGMVCLDSAGAVVREALLWNDTRSAPDAADLIAELGGPGAWADRIGLVPVASFTVTKLRWLARCEPDNARRTSEVLLPHDWLTWRLRGGGPGAGASVAATTDRGDASGTAYYDPGTGRWDTELLRLALRRGDSEPLPTLPRVLDPAEVAGRTAGGVLVAAGTGDNAAAALGLGVGPGEVVVSLGTSGVVTARHDAPSADASGYVANFADATGDFLPLVCTLNAARVLGAAARMLGTDLDGLSRLALAAPEGAGGLTLLPYLDGERTPDLPDAAGSLHGLRRSNMNPANVARASVEGMFCGLVDGLDALRAQGVPVRRVLLIGGATASEAVRTIAPAVFGTSVEVPAEGEYVALGAARQAAWALSGSAQPPAWEREVTDVRLPPTDRGPGAALRAAYASVREQLYS
jgi:xylulokinase